MCHGLDSPHLHFSISMYRYEQAQEWGELLNSVSPFWFKSPKCCTSTLLFTVVSALAGSFSRAILTETPSFSVPLGPRSRLTCTLRSDIGIGDNNIYWTSRCRGALPGFTCAATETQTSHWGLESPLYSLDPEKPQKMLQICTSLNYR